jgi:hypothetical protein
VRLYPAGLGVAAIAMTFGGRLVLASARGSVAVYICESVVENGRASVCCRSTDARQYVVEVLARGKRMAKDWEKNPLLPCHAGHPVRAKTKIPQTTTKHTARTTLQQASKRHPSPLVHSTTPPAHLYLPTMTTSTAEELKQVSFPTSCLFFLLHATRALCFENNNFCVSDLYLRARFPPPRTDLPRRTFPL